MIDSSESKWPRKAASNRPDEEQWDIVRYVLHEESLDREVFESRMADDEQLAIDVAQTVKEIGGLTSVCHELRQSQAAGRSVHAHYKRWLAMAMATAASLLLVLNFDFGRQSSIPQQLDGPAILSAVAERWLVLEVGYEAEDSFLVSAEDDATNSADLPAGEWPTEENDWILEAAREFYQEVES